MANIASSKKDARRSAVRAVRNRSLKSAVKTKITRVRRALTERGEAAEHVEELATTAVSALDRAASKGVLHPHNAARRKSRLMKRRTVPSPSADGPGAEPATAQRGGARKGSSSSGRSSRSSTRKR